MVAIEDSESMHWNVESKPPAQIHTTFDASILLKHSTTHGSVMTTNMHAMCPKNYMEAARMAYETVNMMCAECNRQLDPSEFESMVHLLLLISSN
jgi:NMD protein affecting ribosome stability and mRNA decay